MNFNRTRTLTLLLFGTISSRSVHAFQGIYKKSYAAAFSMRMSSSTSGHANVKTKTEKDLEKFLKGESRNLYQIIDIREPDELRVASLSGADIINLPLSTAGEWSNKVLNGELLSSEKPTLCLVIYMLFAF